MLPSEFFFSAIPLSSSLTPQRITAKCPGCGRFAKFLGESHWYDGNFNQITLTTRCGRCGDLDEDCV